MRNDALPSVPMRAPYGPARKEGLRRKLQAGLKIRIGNYNHAGPLHSGLTFQPRPDCKDPCLRLKHQGTNRDDGPIPIDSDPGNLICKFGKVAEFLPHMKPGGKMVVMYSTPDLRLSTFDLVASCDGNLNKALVL